MMTKKQKEHKLKLIYLIMIVNTEYAKRKPFKNVWETIAFATEQVMWAKELQKVATQRTFESGGLAIVGNNRQAEVILRK
jgi:hypothetical protein